MSSHTESLRDPSRREEDLATAMDIEIGDEQLETIDPPQATRPAQISRATNVLSKLIESDPESGEDAPVQPRRKLISALKNQLSGDSSDSEEDDNGAGAYERIKAQLMSGTTQQEAQKTSQHVPKVTDISSSESEEEIPVRAHSNRRLGARKEKSTSPQPSPSPSARSRRPSPGLFVTPNVSPVKKTAPRPMPSTTSDSDIPQSTQNADLDDRVKRIRAERKAKAQQSKVQEQEKRAKKASRHSVHESDSDPDGENGRRLTQQARPTRKASKKALEDISREQQRISRNMQLTHQAKTKKRYTTKDLMATFGYQMNEKTTEAAQLPTPDPSSAPVSSDVEVNQIHDRPASPPRDKDADAIEDTTTVEEMEMSLDEVLASSPGMRLDKGKGQAPEFQHLPVNPLVAQAQPIIVRNAQVGPRKPASTEMVDLSDSEDEIEIVQSKSRFPVFDRLPQKDQQEAPSLLHLRHLAHLTGSDNVRKPKGAQNLMSVSELQFSLAQKARQQANKEREEKLEDMRRRGIHIETEEEREKQQMEIEDMVTQFEKQRQEDLKLSKLERGEAKKNGETLGDEMLSSDDDEDYVGSAEEGAEEDAVEVEEAEEEAELELSGSEEEDFNDEADDEEELDEEMADEHADEEPEHVNEDENMEEALSVPLRKRTMNRARHIIVDDEDESDEAPSESTATQLLTQVASATQDNVMAAFGFNNPTSSLGLTQVFAGTMANLESNSQDDHPIDKEPEQDSLDFLRSLPDTQPSFSQASDMLVPNSQALDSQQDFLHAGPVSQINLGISQLMEPSPTFPQTQMSDMPEPTQDVGFGLSRSPAGLMAPASTIETVMMAVVESPAMKRKGKLHQRQNRVLADESDVDEASESEANNDEGLAKAGNAFAVMTKAAKRKQAMGNFNKNTSWARDAVEEQAEESEDEYAGIGGADGEDTDEDDEELNEMIDTSDIKVDERKMAAFYAEKSKKEDEKKIEKLYKDVMHGGLRKKARGDAFDMSDSEDEAEQLRRKKQMQFKQMTKALISDDRIGQIAQNPKKMAFFNTLADHLEEPDYEFLNEPEMDVGSQSQSQEKDAAGEGKESFESEISIPDSQTSITATSNPLKRKSPTSQEKENRPPPNLRRTAASDNSIARKPISFADVQTSVMELLDDGQVVVPDSQFSESEEDEEDSQSSIVREKRTIIDRLTLSRTASMSSESPAAGNLAFHAPSASTGPGFRVPSLLRRATSNFSAVSASSGPNTPAEGGVRRGGTGKSNIHAQAREAERRSVLEKKDKKREESLKKKVRKAKGRGGILEDLGGGFE